MRKFRVSMHCKKCGRLLGYKSYFAEVEREEPERFCADCEIPTNQIPPYPPFDKGGMNGLTAKELKAMAKAKGVRAYSRMAKAELIAALEVVDG